MATINKVMVGEALVGDGNEVAHIDLIIGPRNSAAEHAFCTALTNNKDGFSNLLAVVAPNLRIPFYSTKSPSRVPSRRCRCSGRPSAPLPWP